jgi:prolyl-tRNA editing enzyme YbaK/EbsC (Cys-tRNA(Pro) deacylase)
MSVLLPLVEQSLTKYGAVNKILDCTPELADTAAFCEHYGYKSEQSANTIVVASKTEPRQFACCVVLANSRLDVNKAVRQLMDAKKVSFASMDEALQLTGMEYGGVTVFGMPADVPVYVDARVMDCNEIIMGGGNRSSKLLLKPEELRKLPGLQVVDGLAKLADA